MTPLVIAGRTFRSRLFIGTGKFGSHDLMRQAVEASGCELVTVALRRVDLDRNPSGDPLLSQLDPEKVVIVPNTSGARTAEEAVRIARLARAAGGFDWVKLELTPNLHHLLPDPIETLKASEILVKEGFTVLPYINADPVLAKRLEGNPFVFVPGQQPCYVLSALCTRLSSSASRLRSARSCSPRGRRPRLRRPRRRRSRTQACSTGGPTSPACGSASRPARSRGRAASPGCGPIPVRAPTGSCGARWRPSRATREMPREMPRWCRTATPPTRTRCCGASRATRRTPARPSKSSTPGPPRSAPWAGATFSSARVSTASNSSTPQS